jgi:non-heme chloroperoxidase
MSDAPATLRALGHEPSYRHLNVRTPDGLSISVQDWQRPTSGRDVLLMHGFSQSHLCWLKQVSSALADEFRLVSYDLRGHGESDKPLEPHYYREPERWAAEVESVMRATDLHRPVLVPWSYAGRVALDYLTCRGDSGISGMVFVNATSKSDASVQGPATPLLRRMTQEDPASNIEATLALLKACTSQPLPEDELRFMLAFNMVVPPAVRANLAGRPADYEATLRAIQVPVLALHGSDDAINLSSMAQYTSTTVSKGRHEIYRGIGHMPFWENPAVFNRDLDEFLRQLD